MALILGIKGGPEMTNTFYKAALTVRRGLFLLISILLLGCQAIVPVVAHAQAVFTVVTVNSPTPRQSTGAFINSDGSLYATTTVHQVGGTPESTYVVDRNTNTAEFVGYDTDGSSLATRGVATVAEGLSADGRYVLFDASGVFAPRTRSAIFAYVYDRVLHVSTRITIPSDPTLQTGAAPLAMSPDGRYVAVVATSSGTITTAPRAYLYDMSNHTAEMVSVTTSGQPFIGSEPRVSADGRYVVFGGGADVGGPGSMPEDGIYVRDRLAGTTELVSSPGENFFAPSMSDDARYVEYTRQATDGSFIVKVVDRSTATATEQPGAVGLVSGDGSTLIAGNNGGPGTYESPIGAAPVQIGANGDPTSINQNGSAFSVEDGMVTSGGDKLVFVSQQNPPAAPANLTLTVPNPTNQNPSFSWDAVSDAAFYNVYRNGTLIDSVNAGSTSYVDVSAPEGTNIYSVTAQNNSGESTPSNSVSVFVDKTAPTTGMFAWSNNPLPVGTTTNLTVPVADTGGSGIA